MKIAITAANGQLGSAIVNELKKHIDSSDIIGIARSPEKANHLGIEIRKGDYSDRLSFFKALKGIEVLLIVSGNDHPEKRIEQHRNIIEAAKENGIRKIVYNSIYGLEDKCAFDDIIKSNRQTEKDVQDSGMQWSIGRNGLYIDADIEALEDYKNAGAIANSAGNGKCAYTSREELAHAYMNLILNDELNGEIYNLCGEPITQTELANLLNERFDISLKYEALSIEAYFKDRQNVHGEFFGKIIGGIYEGIHNGAFEIQSDFEKVTGRKHLSVKRMLKRLTNNTN